ncbi:type ISP restriction/modification enzyme [Planktosalinus lacus]|uniref:site-specific DNA-methyltransferase (adenine-specific) n=1 Tax=Planktosalinus lacus TaxID=1526573 RepID=A0A8J2V8R7_9FLAO|nr:type ISP restriction/modification enzyme [Planktosalinus lacus]GGD86405.1 DNA methyltransferase [Planktosalinus lacus]
MTIEQYLATINQRYKQGNATEHTFRGDLQQLLETLVPEIRATNEPKRQACGAPDYILSRNGIDVGYIEAKDIGDKDLEGKKRTGNKEQFDRYKASLPNLVFTDYIEFHFYHYQDFVCKISIAEIQNNTLVPLPENFKRFENLIKDFCVHIGLTIKSPKKLAEMMAGKARLLADVLKNALESDEETQANTTLKEQMNAFKEILIHDITPKAFADVYAQTIAYGMFAARLHDPTMSNFSRQEAAELIPKSNPFLRKLFGYIAGPDIDDRIKWIVESLSEVFLACDVSQLLRNYGKSTKMEDPIIHFYETFLSEYDPKLRKSRGVWYTPQPVVDFIVRAVDDILKTEFDLPAGLADTSKTTIKLNSQVPDKRSPSGYKMYDQEVHKVQILDPATGTGTFLAETVKHIYKRFEGQQGIWSNYVEQHLIPRLNGFELLMASYAMAHLKLDLLLTETGFKPTTNQRLRVFLTNSLEESHPDTGTLFSNWLSTEANEANHIKRDTPVMCVIGNPPYSGESANKGDWIMSLMEDYKKEPGGKEKLKEQTSKWINDDYVKFLRYGQHFIEKNGSGVLAFINPHGFLDNPTFRGMRWHLLKTYDKIYTLDLHGNSKKKETCPDGSPDINVFDIMQGVAITIFVKTGKKKLNELGEVYHYDLFGKREFKYEFLNNNNLSSIGFKIIEKKEPMFYMVQRDLDKEEDYLKGFSLNDLFIVNGNGITTAHDTFVIKDSKKELLQWFNDFKNSERNEDLLHNKFQVKKKKGWNILEGYDNIKNVEDLNIYAKKLSYRPFDDKYIFYEDKLVWRTVKKVMSNYNGNNFGLLCPKAFKDASFSHIFITDKISEAIFLSSQTGSNAMNLPLYIYHENKKQQSIETYPKRTPNLNPEILTQIEEKLGLEFVPERENRESTFAPIEILDYIYAVLHSSEYREKYKEFLKIDFPRVPYPTDPVAFWHLVALGGQLRQIHLLESPVVEQCITTYPETGDNIITRKQTKNSPGYEPYDNDTATGRVWINDTQYFDNVPHVAWEFYIGGYQPAQKWLKDRVGRELNFDDILHYQKIIVALSETERLMGEVDGVWQE